MAMDSLASEGDGGYVPEKREADRAWQAMNMES